MTFLDSTGTYRRDLYDALGYTRKLTPIDYKSRYERGGVAERIVEAFPRATWSSGARIQETDDPEDLTEFERATEELFRRLDIWSRLLRADILAGLGRYSVVLIGARGELKSPLPTMAGEDSVLYLTPIHEDNADINTNVTKTSDPRFNLPETYQLKLSQQISKETHWTRVIHMSDGLLEDDIFGKPRLRAVWNYLDDLEKIVGGGAEAAWKRMDPGMQLDLDPEVELTTAEEEALNDEVEEYMHNVRRVMRTRGVELTMLASAVPGFAQNVGIVLKLISAATGIPSRILTGSERGEMASTQDRNNWNDRVAERRREYAEPVIQQLIDRLIDRGALPEPEEYSVQWPDIDELDEIQKAEVANKIANANSSQVASESRVILTADEIRRTVFGLGPLENVPDNPGIIQPGGSVDTGGDSGDGTAGTVSDDIEMKQ
jgi:hypothetical protein